LGITRENIVEEININARSREMPLKKETTVLTGSFANIHAHKTAINERNRIKAS